MGRACVRTSAVAATSHAPPEAPARLFPDESCDDPVNARLEYAGTVTTSHEYVWRPIVRLPALRDF